MLYDKKAEIISLSYSLGSNTPHYGSNERGIDIEPKKSIINGDSCNTFIITFENHIGTHIDCPNHFYSEGKKITDYSLNDLIFYKPQVIKMKLDEGELLDVNDIDGLVGSLTDFLIIYSGWGKYRNEEKYALKNPGIRAEVAKYLQEKYPNVRAIGVDFISISSYIHRAEGRAAHKAFLNPAKEILIIEDMMLASIDEKFTNIDNIMVSPIVIEGVDSTPCNVIATYYK